jgi:hypothetical protein
MKVGDTMRLLMRTFAGAVLAELASVSRCSPAVQKIAEFTRRADVVLRRAHFKG